MSVLMIAPSRPDLPNVATEAAAVVNSLGGKLLQGTVAERDVRDACSDGSFDGIWFATHTICDRVLLSEDALSEAALVAYVAASGVSWCFLNTCQSIALGQRLIDETPADVICTVSANPDPDAMRTGVLFARQLALLGDPRAAYERSKPGGNRLYVYLENYRQRGVAVNSSPGAYPAQERLQMTMDEMRREMSQMASDIAVLKTKLASIETRQERFEYQLRPIPSWQTWAMLAFGLTATIGIIGLLMRAGGG